MNSGTDLFCLNLDCGNIRAGNQTSSKVLQYSHTISQKHMRQVTRHTRTQPWRKRNVPLRTIATKPAGAQRGMLQRLHQDETAISMLSNAHVTTAFGTSAGCCHLTTQHPSGLVERLGEKRRFMRLWDRMRGKYPSTMKRESIESSLML